MNAQWRLWAFLAVGALQIAVPFTQIARHERVLRHGRPYRFVGEPVDPADAFRGRYVAIRLAAATVTQNLDRALQSRPWLAAPIQVGADGFAWFGPLAAEPPRTGDWVRVRHRWSAKDLMEVEPPCDRFYLPEPVAPEVEREYLQGAARRGTGSPPVVVVRVLDGLGVVEDLELGGVPVREWLRRRTVRVR